MKITIANGKASIFTPYNGNFVKRIKQLDSKWDGYNKCWIVNENAVDSVRAIMIDVYGESDIQTATTIDLTIKIIAADKVSIGMNRDDVTFLGKTLAHAWGRDSGAKAGSDVHYQKGKPTSGGSAKNWYSEVTHGSVIRLTNVNKNLYDKYIADPTIEIFSDEIEIIETSEEKNDKNKLKAEKEALLKRLAEINDILGETMETVHNTTTSTAPKKEVKDVEKATSKKLVMGRAWTLARKAVKEYGGKATDYFSKSLKMAWAELRDYNATLLIV